MKTSITTRLALMFASVALLTFSLIGIALYGVLRAELARQQTDVLTTTANEMLYALNRMGNTERWSRAETKMDTLTPADGSLRFWILSPDPAYAYGKDVPAVLAAAAPLDGFDSVAMPGHEYPMRILVRTVPALQERPEVKFIVGMETAPYFHTLHTFLIALASLLLSAVLLIMLLGHWVARMGLLPLQRLSSEASMLSPLHLAQRLNVATLPIELADLAGAFNGALSRLETAYTRLEAFNADVAHELRTPLTNLIGQTQVALSRRRSAAELEEVLQSNLEELDSLRAIVNDMLFLARADQGEAATGLVRTPVATEVGKTIEFFEFVLDDMRLAVDIEGDTRAEASLDTARFRRALTNLLQNAIQHTERGQRITVRIEPRPGTVRIAVSNPGPPIDPVHLPRLFDRFYRVDASRHDNGDTHGHGLGLAIVKAVATMHGGEVFASSGDGTTTIGFSVLA
ncbi:histidine kinase [Bordetella sp. H567]|uniref:heavy metal sensor histidine kinase n=1 Tax=Bordetella sp. H567 TaxID=1697043 RepID=UPI00081C7733|nr:heavy metal sensor histidine kinase [Bordetella sp. H567]AOB32602.1 histidine kinase [Bordetella sp. H567]